MRAILVNAPGGPEALVSATVDDLPVGARDIRILVVFLPSESAPKPLLCLVRW